MNKYENVVIVDPNLDEEALNKLIERFTKLINKHGKVMTVENIGLKQLAYEIKKNKEAYYVVYNFESEPSFIEELQRNYRITDEILKFLVIKVDEFDEKQLKKVEKKVEKDVEIEEKVEETSKKETKKETKKEEKLEDEKQQEIIEEVKEEQQEETEKKEEKK